MHYNGIPFDYMGDSGKYMHPALGLLNLGAYGKVVAGIYHTELTRLPFYPGLIYICYLLFGPNNIFSVAMTQCLLMGGLVLAAGMTAELLTRRYYWFAVIIAALSPNLFFRSSLILPDLMFAFFIMWGIYYVVKYTKENKLSLLLLSSLLFSFAFLTRPALVLYPVFTLPFLFLLCYSHKANKVWQSLGSTMLGVFIIFLVVSPWVIREKSYTGTYMLSMQSGFHSLSWIYPTLSSRWGGRRDINAIKEAESLFKERVQQLPQSQQLSPAALNELQHQLAIELISQIPKPQLIRAVVGSSLKLLFYTSMLGISEAFHHKVPHVSTSASDWRQTLSDLLKDPWQELILFSQLMVFLLRAVQLVGIIYGIAHKQYRYITLYLLAGALSFVAVSVGIGNPRYRVPIEPALIIFTVFGCMAIRQYLKAKFPRIQSKSEVAFQS